MAAYSGTPLIKKLGVREESKVMLLNAPKGYMNLLESDISKQFVKEISKADFIHLFVTSREELAKEFHRIIKDANNNLTIWISWHKKSAGISTDITENVIR